MTEPLPRKCADISGQKYGRLTALKFSHINKYNKAVWICACDCGGWKLAAGNSMKKGRIKSCGCLSRDFMASLTAHRRERASTAEAEKRREEVLRNGKQAYQERNKQKLAEKASLQIKFLGDNYIKRIIAKSVGLSASDIPEEMVAAHRAVLSVKRQLRKIKHEITGRRSSQDGRSV